MVPYFGFQNFSHHSKGTFFVAEFWNFSKSVPFLFVIFGTFLKKSRGYIFGGFNPLIKGGYKKSAIGV